MTKQRSYQLLDYSKVREILGEESTNVDFANEGNTRPLAQLDTPEQQRTAWKLAAEVSGGKPTAKIVKDAV